MNSLCLCSLPLTHLFLIPAAFGVDCFSWPPFAEIFLNHFGDLESATWIMEKQMEFQRLSFEVDGQWGYAHAGLGLSTKNAGS